MGLKRGTKKRTTLVRKQTMSPTRVGRYEVFCVETGRGSHGSVFVCSITDLVLGKEVGTVNFMVQRTPYRYIVVESPSGFREAFNKVFGEMKADVFTRGRSSKVAGNLEWMVKTVIEKGLWDPGKEFSNRI
jgi:hypothetical protein